MQKFIKFPSIEQFRTIAKNISTQSAYVGQDDEGNAIFDYSREKPVLTFKGTVKLHGTNAGVCLNSEDFWVQSRSNIITTEKDNAGFAFFVSTKESTIRGMMQFSADYYGIDLSQNTLSLFGEWAGGNIQKGVAISGLEKMFVIFGLKVSPNDESKPAYWVDENLPFLTDRFNNIYNINLFKTYSITIDFNNPSDSQNVLIALTNEVEKECPVGKYFERINGVDCTTGEGIVWSFLHEDGTKEIFKVKGEAHSSSKVKTLASVDTEKLNSIKEFVEYSVTENRLYQGIEYVFTQQSKIPDIKEMGTYIKWVVSDIIKEELDTIASNGLEPKDVSSTISTKARDFFKTYLNDQAFKGIK